jgi:hypothetical protein
LRKRKEAPKGLTRLGTEESKGPRECLQYVFVEGP